MDLSESKIMAGIVTFNPDMEELRRTIAHLNDQFVTIVIVDNASLNYEEIYCLISDNPNVLLFENEFNAGVAAALNQIMQYAFENQYEWVLTVDQDSFIEPQLLKKYREYLNLPQLGMLTCYYKDRNTGNELENLLEEGVTEVRKAITSGSLLNVAAWEVSEKFDEKLFIDYVDFDMCIRLIQHQYKILRVNFVGISHAIGSAKKIKLLGNDIVIKGRPIVVYNESVQRTYYFFRNTIFICRKYKRLAKGYTSPAHILWRALLVFMFENPKIPKMKMVIKGIMDGLRMKVE